MSSFYKASILILLQFLTLSLILQRCPVLVARAKTRQCSNIFDTEYNSLDASMNNQKQKELIILNGMNRSNSFGVVRVNQKNISPNNRLNFSLEFSWNNVNSRDLWWSVIQKITSNNLSSYDKINFDLYPIKANKATHLRIFLTEEDGDRWIVSDLNLNNDVKQGTWNHFEVKRDLMKPWLLGDKELDWHKIRTLTIEPWSISPRKGQAVFLLDGIKLLGSKVQPLEVFNTEDDGDWVNPVWKEPIQSLPAPGVIYLPGIGVDQLSGTPKQFQNLLGRIGTSHVIGSRATELSKNGIPVLGYTALVQGYEKFLTRRGAWDVNVRGEGPGNIPFITKSFTYFHTISMPHTGVGAAVQDRIDKMLQSGIGIFMAVDYVLPWREGPFGYSETMQAAYRDDLLATDTGLLLTEGKNVKLIHFPDYFRLYHGFYPEAQDLGLSNWKAFLPPKTVENTVNNRAYWQIFTFLRSYEWLKLAGRTGRYMQCRGGHGLWVIPNPEDSQGSSDYAMLLQTSGVTNVFPEWFGRVATMSSAAYVSGPYLREQANRGNSRLSVLFETGSGGHAAPYWDWQVAFNGAYSLTAATQADDFDNDFIDQAPFDEMRNPKKNPSEFRRFRDTVAKALGFQMARQQNAKRARSKILCVTERPPKEVSSFFFSIEDKLRPSLAGSLWRTHTAFDLRDSLELEKVIDRYDLIFYDVLSPRVGDFEHLRQWLMDKPDRVLVTHSFVPTRSAKDYWGAESGTNLGSVKNSPLALGQITTTNVRNFSLTSAVEPWKSFVTMNRNFTLSSPLTRSQYSQPLVMTDRGPLVSKTSVGKGNVIYLHYTPGNSVNIQQLDDALTFALLKQTKQENLAIVDKDVAVQSFNVPGGKSVVVWDMPTERNWAKKFEKSQLPLPWQSSKLARKILLPAKHKQTIYDFWSNKKIEALPHKGYITLNWTGSTSKLFLVGLNSKELESTISKASKIRKKMSELNF